MAVRLTEDVYWVGGSGLGYQRPPRLHHSSWDELQCLSCLEREEGPLAGKKLAGKIKGG